MLISLEYLVGKYNLLITGILHVGACRLEELNIYKQMEIKNVLWIEANKKLVDKMKNIFPKEKIFNVCLGEKDNEIKNFMITNNEQSSSLLSFGTHLLEHPSVFEIENIKVETMTLDTFKIKFIPNEKFNFINLDIQGMELSVLQNGINVLDGVNYIYTEINVKELYKGCGLLDEMDLFLGKYGFERVETKLLEHGWGDAFYIKKHKLRRI